MTTPSCLSPSKTPPSPLTPPRPPWCGPFRANQPLGLTRAQYLWRVRLAGAHEDLPKSDPTTGDTIRAIATKWGFPHPSRLAGAYCTAYGVTPRRTLER